MSGTARRAEQPTLLPLQVPRQCPREMADLIHDCMKQRPEDRPTAKEIFNILKVPARIPDPHSPVCQVPKMQPSEVEIFHLQPSAAANMLGQVPLVTAASFHRVQRCCGKASHLLYALTPAWCVYWVTVSRQSAVCRGPRYSIVSVL